MEKTLAQRVRERHPGSYDDLDDAELERRVLEKYPGVYDDLPRTAAQQDQEEEPRGLASRLGRQLGLTVRAGITGAGSVAEPFAAAGRSYGRALTGLLPEPLRDVARAGIDRLQSLPSVEAGASALGLPEAQTPTERIAYAGAKGLAAAALPLGAALAARPVGMAAQGVAEALAQAPGAQLASAAAGATAAEGVKEAGGPAWLQVGAGLIAGAGTGWLLTPGTKASTLTRTERKVNDILQKHPERFREAVHLINKAKDYGVDVNLAEAADLPSLKRLAYAVSKSIASSDIIDDANRVRRDQIAQAWSDFADGIGPEDAPALVGRDAVAAAGATLKRLEEARSAAAGPYYQRAYQEFTGLPKTMLPRVSALRKRLPAGSEKEAVKIARMEGLDLSDPGNSLRGMHYIKKHLDRLLSAERDPNMRRILHGQKRELLEIMNEVSPKDEQGRSLYALGSAIYEGASPQVALNRDGLVGEVFRLTEKSEIKAAEKLLSASNSSPIAASRAMRQLRATDPEVADKVLRQFLQDTFEKAGADLLSQPGKTLQGARTAKQLMAPRQQDILKAVMTGKQWNAFDGLMETFRATSRVPLGGSDTTWNAEAQRLLAAGELSAPAEMMGRIIEHGMVREAAYKVFRMFAEGNARRNAAEFARVLTNPETANKLRSITTMPPGPRKTILLADLFGVFSTQDMEQE